MQQYPHRGAEESRSWDKIRVREKKREKEKKGMEGGGGWGGVTEKGEW